MTVNILIILWVIICIAILTLSIVNFFTLQQLQTQVNTKIPPTGKSVTQILMENWDIVGSALVIVIFITTLIFRQNVYFGHIIFMILAFILTIAAVAAMIIVRRIVLKNKYK